MTLGPAGTNHEFVAEKYLAFHELNAEVALFETFDEGLELFANNQLAYPMMAAVHKDCADVVAKAQFNYDIRILDTFKSPSRGLAICTRRDVKHPRSIGIQPSTAKCADLSAWK